MSPFIRTAVFPVAGLGSRFLPATKASPKEMLPIVDKPLIQYAVEEAVAAGITNLVFITGRNKRSIEDHFDKAYELETELELSEKHALLETVRDVLPKSVNCIYIRQPQAFGLGHAVLCAEPVVRDEPFVVLLADDFIDAKPGVTAQLVAHFRDHPRTIIGVQRVRPEDTRAYGIVEVSATDVSSLWQVHNIVEKPLPQEAPSDVAVIGRYVLQPEIFSYLRKITPGVGGEIQLTDAIAALLQDYPVLAYQFVGTRYDCGSKLGYLQAMVNMGCQHHEIGEEFSDWLAHRCCAV